MSYRLLDDRDVDIVARTLWGEARGEGRVGMTGVACVIRNRVRHPGRWGEDYRSVCLAPGQFQAWGLWRTSLARARLLAVTGADPSFTTAIAVAVAVMAGKMPDITGGATCYYRVGTRRPGWARGLRPTCRIGHHLFFRIES